MPRQIPITASATSPRIRPVLARMAEIGMPLLVHGEVTDPSVDVFDREAVFIDRTLRPLADVLPTLKIVLEHVTTEQGVDFVRRARPGNLGATITAHHLAINRNAMFQGGIRPHFYCLPVAKREAHRQALRPAAATSGDPRFFPGTDSAPHFFKTDKETACLAAPGSLYRTRRARNLRAGLRRRERARAARSLRLPQRPALLRPPRERRTHHAEARERGHVPAEISGDAGAVKMFRGGEKCEWKIFPES